jgi:peptidase C39-like protein
MSQLQPVHRNFTHIDAGALNTWLSQNNGYFGDDDVIWDAITAYTGGRLSWSGWSGPDLGLVQAELDAGRPVIVQVSLNGNQHFVIVTGSSDQGLTINDPWFGDRANFSDRYGDPSTGIVSIRTYVPAVAPQVRPPSLDQGAPASDAPGQRQAQ